MVANEAITVDMKQYQELLQRLRKNEENVPRDLLLTKYEEPYTRLRNEIADMTSQILKDIVLFGWRVEREEAIDVYSVINRVIVESGILQEVNHAVYQEQNVDKVLNCAALLRILICQKMKEQGL